uniref:Uncharacterized protein n=1 Tax=Arundo donax TaxID=35708 RepID=A0A0A9BTU6_ARUDO
MKPAAISLSTSAVISFCNSGRKRRAYCFTGRNRGSMASLCVATRGSSPGISL